MTLRARQGMKGIACPLPVATGRGHGEGPCSENNLKEVVPTDSWFVFYPSFTPVP